MAAANEPVRIRVARLARRTAGLGLYAAGAVVGSKYARLLGLRAAAELALENGRLDRAQRLPEELLDLASAYRDDWYYGNALHNGHSILGLVEMKRRNFPGAAAELLEAGEGLPHRISRSLPRSRRLRRRRRLVRRRTVHERSL